MKTKLFSSLQISEAAELMKAGEVVAFPTETVYGLGAPLFQVETVKKIFSVKRRPADNPLIVHLSKVEQVEEVAVEIPALFYALAGRFFPGPLTLVLKRHPRVPAIVSGGMETIAVRMPAHPVAQELIAKVGQPLVAPSANLSGKPSSTTAEHVLHDFAGQIGGVIDGGATNFGVESTVISLLDPSAPLLLRLGVTQIEDLGIAIGDASKNALKASPGTRYRHYAPEAPLKLFDSLKSLENEICKSPDKKRHVIKTVSARTLYAELRKADVECVEEILLYCSPEVLKDGALMDRITRASHSTS